MCASKPEHEILNQISTATNGSLSDSRSRYPTEAVQVSGHSAKGLILIAMRDFEPEDVLSSVASYEIASNDIERIQNTDFYKFVFYPPGTNLSNRPSGFVAFGPVSFCSHSNTPNARVKWRFTGSFNAIELSAIRKIEAGEEVTIRYSNIEEYLDHQSWI